MSRSRIFFLVSLIALLLAPAALAQEAAPPEAETEVIGFTGDSPHPACSQ